MDDEMLELLRCVSTGLVWLREDLTRLAQLAAVLVIIAGLDGEDAEAPETPPEAA